MNDDKIKPWKQTLSAYVERCRDWSHTSSCEYLNGSCIPISLEGNQQFLCSCGTDRLPSRFMPVISRWESVSKYARRIAISPSFSVPYVEVLFKIDYKRLSKSYASKCNACSKEERSRGMALLKCARCQKIRYCSTECWRSR